MATLENTIGEWVREERQKRGWTQQQLADKLGWRQPDVSDLENNRHVPSIDTAKKLARIFSVSPASVVAKLL